MDASSCYSITGRYTNGTKIIGYQITSDTGEIKVIKVEDLERLIENGNIHNCKIISYNDTRYIHCIGFKMSQLPIINNIDNNCDRLTITGRIFKDNKLIGYIVSDEKGQGYRLSKEKVWMSARNKNITNALASLNGVNKVIRYTGVDIKDLPVIRV